MALILSRVHVAELFHGVYRPEIDGEVWKMYIAETRDRGTLSWPDRSRYVVVYTYSYSPAFYMAMEDLVDGGMRLTRIESQKDGHSSF
jgi:hypothetical protein